MAGNRYTSKNTTVQIQDSTGTYDVTVGPGAGDFSFDPIEEDNSEAIAVMDRGVFDGFVEGDDLVQNWSISIQLRAQELTHAAQDRILDAVRKTGLWASATTVDPGNSKWAFKLIVTMNDGSTTSVITLPCCRGKAAFSEGKEGHTLSLSGTNHQAPTFS